MAELTGGAKEEKQSTGSTNNTGTVLANNGKTQVVAPIVDVLSRKPQTIINVTSVMTGAGMPSYMSASMPPIATAPTAPTGANSNNPWAAYMNNGAYAGMYGAYPTMQTAQGYYPPAAYNYGYNYPGYYGMPTDGANPPPLPGAPPPPDFGSTPSPRNNGSYFPPPNSG